MMKVSKMTYLGQWLLASMFLYFPPYLFGVTALDSAGCGAKEVDESRIVGGHPADAGEYPWLVAMVRPVAAAAGGGGGGDGGTTGQFCGATIITDRHVITAAHCVAPFTKDQITLKLGEYDLKKEGPSAEVHKVESILAHPAYNPKTQENDIAIMVTEAPIKLSADVRTLCLPSSAAQTYVDQRADIIGWGTIYFGGPVSSLLQEASIRVWENSKCAQNYAKLGREIKSSMLCAGDEGRDSCQGDSGGPLNCYNVDANRWELCGIVSWGARCAEKDFPGVYTRVTSFLDWIKAAIETTTTTTTTTTAATSPATASTIISASVRSSKIEITTKDGKKCLAGSNPKPGAPAEPICSTVGQPTVPWCATELNADNSPKTKANCFKLSGCDKKTWHEKDCLAFSFRNVTYAKGECSYDDAEYELPWCPFIPITTDKDLIGTAGQVNWDYCNRECTLV